MKAKVKFDQARLKAFAIEHVEKIVFGAFVLAFVIIAWSGFKLKRYESTPDALQSLATKVSQQIETGQPPDKIDGLKEVPNFSSGLGERGPALVSAGFYAIRPLDRPLHEKMILRKEPKFLALHEPLAFGGFGPIAIGETGAVHDPAAALADDAAPGGMSGMAGGMGPGGSGSDSYGGMKATGQQGPTPEMMARMAGGGTQEMMKSRGAAPGASGGMAVPGGQAKKPSPREAKAEKARQKKAAEAERQQQEAAALAARKKEEAGKIVLADTPSGAHLEGRYWVCVTGAIPYFEQLRQYQEAFGDATIQSPQDLPRYVLSDIERAEVVSGGEPDWQPVDVRAAYDDMFTWAAKYPDYVDQTYLDNVFASEPLPPLIGENHDPKAVTHPLVPTLVSMAKKKAEEAAAKRRKAQESGKPKGHGRTPSRKGRGTSGFARSGPTGSGGGMSMGGPMGPGGGMGGPMGPGGGMGGPMGPGGGMGGPMGPGGGMGGPMGPGGGMSGAMATTSRISAARLAMAAKIEYRLFRFFDFDVKPGKTYQYRVKLAFENPNRHTPQRYVEDYKFVEEEFRFADWSSPTAPVTVPLGGRLLAGAISQRGKSEPTAKLMVKQFDRAAATSARREFVVTRGAVLNESDVEIALAESTPDDVQTAEVDFQTDALLVDMVGGDSVRGSKNKAPGHMLVLDKNGDFVVLNEATDAVAYRRNEQEIRSRPDAGGERQPAAPGRGARERRGGRNADRKPESSNNDAFNNFGALDDNDGKGNKPKRGK
jgi:hypothetical protein